MSQTDIRPALLFKCVTRLRAHSRTLYRPYTLQWQLAARLVGLLVVIVACYEAN